MERAVCSDPFVQVTTPFKLDADTETVVPVLYRPLLPTSATTEETATLVLSCPQVSA